MERLLIFGAGLTEESYINELSNQYDIQGFLDNDKNKWGKELFGYTILGDSTVVHSIKYDRIIINTQTGLKIVKQQLLDEGVRPELIDSTRLEVKYHARVNFIYDYSRILKRNNQYSDESVCVAEGGVYQGDFSKEINNAFPDKTLFLFDTFDGFDSKDVLVEKKSGFSDVKEHHLDNTSIDLVLGKLSFPEKAIIKKGYFPDTTIDVNKSFCFVNLDFDLHKPTYEGLIFFYPRMIRGGGILIHDYFVLPGVREAVDCFLDEMGLTHYVPIGDHSSLLVIQEGH